MDIPNAGGSDARFAFFFISTNIQQKEINQYIAARFF
jgi:hypothetical protein